MLVPTDRPVHRSPVRVRYAETDRMGVAYYANYLIWMEVARTDFLRAYGVRYRDLERRGILLPVSDVQVRMLQAARYDDELAVDCWLESARSRQVVFGYVIHHVEDGETQNAAAHGTTALLCVDTDLNPRRLPPEVLDRFGELCPGARA